MGLQLNAQTLFGPAVSVGIDASERYVAACFPRRYGSIVPSTCTPYLSIVQLSFTGATIVPSVAAQHSLGLDRGYESHADSEDTRHRVHHLSAIVILMCLASNCAPSKKRFFHNGQLCPFPAVSPGRDGNVCYLPLREKNKQRKRRLLWPFTRLRLRHPHLLMTGVEIDQIREKLPHEATTARRTNEGLNHARRQISPSRGLKPPDEVVTVGIEVA